MPHNHAVSIIKGTTVSTIAADDAADYPSGVAMDGKAIIVADMHKHVIRRIAPPNNHQAVMSSLAGTGVMGYQDGEGTVAQFDSPSGVAVDGDGNVFVADPSNHRIRLITPQGLVSTLAGTGEKGHRDGEGTVAQFDSPSGVAVDGEGNVIVADRHNNRIRKITPQGQVSTLAGTGVKGYRDGREGTATVDLFDSPFGVAVDRDGNIIVADMGNHCIRKISKTGRVSTLAGTGTKGHRNGEGVVSQFHHPSGIAVDGDGNIIVADKYNHRICLITPQGQASTLAGTGKKGNRDGEGTDAQFYFPTGVAMDGDGNIIVADTRNGRIRLVASDGGV